MKNKIYLSILIVLCSTLFFSCKNNNTTNNEEKTTSQDIIYTVDPKNNIFTNDFFAGISTIRADATLGSRQLTRYEDILKFCQLFASLEFTDQAENDSADNPYEVTFGGFIITLHYEDGKEYEIMFTSKYLYYKDFIYTFQPEQSEELITELHKLFGD